jgi:hypothetical protein
MRNIIALALIAGFLAGCHTAPMNDEEWAAQLNSNYRIWPPIVPGQAFPDQIMDGGKR